MTEPVKHSLKLSKNSRSSGSSYKRANSLTDKMMRVMYLFMLFALDLIMFVYSVNGKLFENGSFNPALLYIFIRMFIASFVLIFALFFSKDLQNVVCSLLTLVFVIVFYNQFALFDVNTFIESWLSKNSSAMSFLAFIPSVWMVGIFFAVIIFFAFRYSLSLFFIVVVLLLSMGLGIKNNEFTEVDSEEYYVLKNMYHNHKSKQNHNLVYFMIPEFPSYHFLSNVKNGYFRELRDLMIGFYANNDFEIYPNAFVEKDDVVSNIVDIYNQVDYTSTTSSNRGYAEIIHEWNFRKGSLDTHSLEFNELYDVLKKEEGYNISTYSAPEFNLCYKKDDLLTDRCVVKNHKNISLYDKNASKEKNIYAILGEWISSIKMRELKSLAKMLIGNSNLKGRKVLLENRRVSIEGATKLFELLEKDFVRDNDGVAYMVYVDLPADVYVYDEYCNLKPEKDWVAIKDNSLYSGGMENKRRAYAEQAKCLIGKMQGFMNAVKESGKLHNTDIIIQGVSNIKELSDLQAGRYSNFVKDRLVNLAIRKGKNPKFLINANICLASDFTKSYLRYQDFCYTIDNMKMPSDEMYSLKQNLINNSVIRGNKISNIAINYREWYEDFSKKSHDVIEKQKKDKKEKEVEEVKLTIETMDVASEPVVIDDSSAAYYDVETFNPDNIYTPTDELIPDETFLESKEAPASIVEVLSEEEKVEPKVVEEHVVSEVVEEKVEPLIEKVEEQSEFIPAEFSEDSQIDF